MASPERSDGNLLGRPASIDSFAQLMTFRQHALMQYPRNRNAILVPPVKDDVPSTLHPAKPWPDPATTSAQHRIPCQA